MLLSSTSLSFLSNKNEISGPLPTSSFSPLIKFTLFAGFLLTMAASKAEGKRRLQEAEDEEEEGDFGDQIGDLGFRDETEKKKRGKRGSSGGGMAAVICQADGCTSDMANAKRYHRRHRVCEFHSKAPFVLVAGIQQRFCQQCSRFHDLVEFDDSKRSCRQRLAGHNERRRKSSSEFHVYGPN